MSYSRWGESPYYIFSDGAYLNLDHKSVPEDIIDVFLCRLVEVYPEELEERVKRGNDIIRRYRSANPKFTIVSKNPKGKKRNVIYKIEYLRNDDPEVLEIEMVWIDFLNKPAEFKFSNGRETFKQLTEAEQEAFKKELLKFLKEGKGGKSENIGVEK